LTVTHAHYIQLTTVTPYDFHVTNSHIWQIFALGAIIKYIIPTFLRKWDALLQNVVCVFGWPEFCCSITRFCILITISDTQFRYSSDPRNTICLEIRLSSVSNESTWSFWDESAPATTPHYSGSGRVRSGGAKSRVVAPLVEVGWRRNLESARNFEILSVAALGTDTTLHCRKGQNELSFHTHIHPTLKLNLFTRYPCLSILLSLHTFTERLQHTTSEDVVRTSKIVFEMVQD